MTGKSRPKRCQERGYSAAMALKASRKPRKLHRLARRLKALPVLSATTTRHQPDQDMSLKMAQGIKRLGMPVAAFLGLALIGLITMSWFLNRDALRQAVEAQIRAVTGLDLVVKGNIDVSVFPASYVSFHDVGLKGGGTADPALAVDVLTANLRLLPLLLQRFQIADVMMLRPHIHVVREADGASNWTPFIQTIARAMKLSLIHISEPTRQADISYA